MDASHAALSSEELARYARHLVLPEVGREGQTALREARIALVGAGGLGSPAALYLAAAGVGTLGLIDFDYVDLTNLQRQILHGTSDIGRTKLASAADRLQDVNPHVVLELHEERLSSANALDLLAGYDLVLDGTDNFPTRYLVNDACVLLGIPNVYGAILRWEGQASLFAAPGGPCYRCLFREPPPAGLVPNCAEAGVVGVLPGIVGSIQALEAIKWILRRGESLVGRLLLFDALAMRFREIELERDPTCPVCGDQPTVTALIDYERFCGVPAPVPGVEVEAVDAELRTAQPPLLVDVREAFEWQAGNLAHLGALWIPLGDLERRVEELPTDRALVIYCATGVRSAKAVEALRQRGYHNSRNLEGGYRAWTLRYGAGAAGR
ncbi:MAG: molybdopterin-synthase adenylyltransferase MoeB [Gemmatimonadota bacterium]